MSDINDQFSDSSSETNWPLDHLIRQRHDDRVVFENVADQYVKGADVTAFFTILQDTKINPDENQIGLLRVGCTNIKECLAYAPVQLTPSTTSGSTRHGTATFPSSVLPVTDDEFYQFCYIVNKTKNIGSSIPFQLNCALDDIDLLSNKPIRKTLGDGLIALADHDNDDFLVVHTKSVLTEEKLRQENRQLLETNRRLESEKDEFKTKFDLVELKSKEHSTRMFDEIQSLTASYKTAVDELTSRQKSETKLISDYNECRALCVQYKTESEQHAERCRTLETSYAQIFSEANQLRSQLAITSQLTKDQATQVIDLERRLMQANEISKATDQRQATLEQQINDLRLTSDKNQAQIESLVKLTAEKDDQIGVLEKANSSLQEEIHSAKENHESSLLILKKNSELAEQLQNQLDQTCEQHRLEHESAQQEIMSLKCQLNKMESVQQAYITLQTSYKEIEKRCVKHQKSEIEAKKKLAAFQDFVNDLQREIQELKDRLAVGAEEYRTLFRKYAVLEPKQEANQQPKIEPQEKPKVEPQEQTQLQITQALTNSHVNDDDDELYSVLAHTRALEEEKKREQKASIQHILNNREKEVDACPMCYWEFPKNMTMEKKTEHVEGHFQ